MGSDKTEIKKIMISHNKMWLYRDEILMMSCYGMWQYKDDRLMKACYGDNTDMTNSWCHILE